MRDYILRHIIAAYVTDENGDPVWTDIVDHEGVSLLSGFIPAVPVAIGSIPDAVLTVGGNPVVVNLTQFFDDATAYQIAPASTPGVTLSGSTLTINPTVTLSQRLISVSGRNTTGTSEPLTFALTINAVLPTITAILPDQAMSVGDANVVFALSDYFANAASYTISPSGQGVTISAGVLTISTAAPRNATYSVTARNSTGQTVTARFALVVTAAPAPDPNPNPEPNTITWTADGMPLRWTAGEQPLIWTEA